MFFFIKQIAKQYHILIMTHNKNNEKEGFL